MCEYQSGCGPGAVLFFSWVFHAWFVGLNWSTVNHNPALEVKVRA